MTTLASARERNHSTLRHSSRKLAVEALVGSVLPGLARIDQRRGDAALGDPLEDRVADELRPVVRAQEERRSVRADETREHLDHALGADRAGHVDGQAFVGELVDDRQALDLLALGGGVEDEVVGPDEVGVGSAAAAEVGRWRCAGAACAVAAAAPPGARACACGARRAGGPGGAGRCGCVDSRSAGTAPRASSWPQSQVRPSPAGVSS